MSLRLQVDVVATLNASSCWGCDSFLIQGPLSNYLLATLHPLFRRTGREAQPLTLLSQLTTILVPGFIMAPLRNKLHKIGQDPRCCNASPTS